MDVRFETAWLLDFYGPLLTQRQRQILRLYCEEDLSLAEIAEQEAISRQSVHDTVHKAQRQLEEYENKLGLLARYRRITQGLERCGELLAHAQDENAVRARALINELIEEEEG